MQLVYTTFAGDSVDISVPDAAERLGVDRVTVWRWVQAGEFPNAYRLNPNNPRSPYRIPEEDITAFEEKRRGHQINDSQKNDS